MENQSILLHLPPAESLIPPRQGDELGRGHDPDAEIPGQPLPPAAPDEVARIEGEEDVVPEPVVGREYLGVAALAYGHGVGPGVGKEDGGGLPGGEAALLPSPGSGAAALPEGGGLSRVEGPPLRAPVSPRLPDDRRRGVQRDPALGVPAARSGSCPGGSPAR